MLEPQPDLSVNFRLPSDFPSLTNGGREGDHIPSLRQIVLRLDCAQLVRGTLGLLTYYA